MSSRKGRRRGAARTSGAVSGRRGAQSDYSGHKGLLKRVWEIVGLWPDITDPGLARRTERFLLEAPFDELFEITRVVFEEATPYLLEDGKVRGAMQALSGRSVGLAIEGEYEVTVHLENLRFRVYRGIEGDIPVLSVASRRDYADAVLNRRDPLTMFVKGQIKVKHLLTLVGWFLPQIMVLLDRPLFDKFLGYQEDVERLLDAELSRLGY